jgi:hypothetical protein
LPLAGSATLPITVGWGSGLALSSDEDPDYENQFPLARDERDDHFWYVSHGHEIDENHRRAIGMSPDGTRVLNGQRYAYDISMRRWDDDADAWTKLIPLREDNTPPTEPFVNSDFLAYGEEVHAVAGGHIIRCSDGVPENDPSADDDEPVCDPSDPTCFYGNGGNSIRILHADNTVSAYFHMQPGLDLCPYDNDAGPVDFVWVDQGQVIGRVGNSGNSSGPHLHFALLEYPQGFDFADPDLEHGDFADGIPVVFNDVWAHDPSIGDPDNFPELSWPMGQWAHWSDMIIRHHEPGGEPFETSCLETNLPGGQSITEDEQVDGDAPPHNGIGLYCLDDTEEPYATWVCVENDDSTSDCQMCGGAIGYPGCPCAADSDCDGGDTTMTCYGVPDGSVEGGPAIGKCFPANEPPPWWVCPYDCKAQFNDPYAWCYSQHPSGLARCVPGIIDPIHITECWEDEGQLIPNVDWPDPDDDTVPKCVAECTLDPAVDECHDVWHYPAPYECAAATGGNWVCTRPSS